MWGSVQVAALFSAEGLYKQSRLYNYNSSFFDCIPLSGLVLSSVFTMLSRYCIQVFRLFGRKGSTITPSQLLTGPRHVQT